MAQHTVTIMITIAVYLVGMVIIGILCSKKNTTVGDFYLGGRKLGPLVAAMSAEASDMSSWLLMGLPGVAYLTGFADAGWTAIGLAIGTYANWLLVAKRLRVYTNRVNAITIPDFFENRFHDKKHVLMGISALVILIFFVPYTASGFSACGKLFESLFGLDYHIAMILSAVIIIAYTSTGGFLAASTTDLVQSIIMSAALIILVVFGVTEAGGLGAVAENAKELPGYFAGMHIYDPDTGTSRKYNIISVFSTLAWGLGYFGMPHILLRFMAIEDEHKIKTSRRIASVWVVISMGAAVLIGFIGNKLSANGLIEKLTTSGDSEKIVIKTADLLSKYGIVAAIFAGLIFSGIFASTMSTSDSQLLAASSSMSENILKGVFKMKLSDKTSMIIARVVLLVIAAISIVIAWNPDSSIFQIVSFAWAGFGATFAPCMITALFWEKTNKWGALAGMVSGGIMVFVWKFFIRPLGGGWDIYELLPAFIVSLVFIVVVSLATGGADKEIEKEFRDVKELMKK